MKVDEDGEIYKNHVNHVLFGFIDADDASLR